MKELITKNSQSKLAMKESIQLFFQPYLLTLVLHIFLSLCLMIRGDDGPELVEEWPETIFTPVPGKGALGEDTYC